MPPIILMPLRMAARLLVIGALAGAGFGFLLVGGFSLIAAHGSGQDTIDALSSGATVGLLVGAGMGAALGLVVGFALGLYTTGRTDVRSDHYHWEMNRRAWLYGVLGWIGLTALWVLPRTPNLIGVLIFMLTPSLAAGRAAQWVSARLAEWQAGE